MAKSVRSRKVKSNRSKRREEFRKVDDARLSVSVSKLNAIISRPGLAQEAGFLLPTC